MGVAARAVFPVRGRPDGTWEQMSRVLDEVRGYADSVGVPRNSLKVRVNTTLSRKIKSVEVEVPGVDEY